MKNYIGLILLLFTSFSLFSQENQPDLKKRKKTENKISFIEYKYLSGEYDEVVESSKSFARNLSKNEQFWIKELVQIKLLHGLAEYASLDFEEADVCFKEAEGLAEKSSSDTLRISVYTLLADYLQETEQLVRAAQYIEKAEALLQKDYGQRIRYDLELVKIKIFLKQDYLNEAWKLLEEQKNYRVEMAASFSVSEENRVAVNEKTDFHKRKEKYAEYNNLKAICLFEKGSLKEAEDLLKNNQVWIQTNLGKTHLSYRDALELLATIYHVKREYDRSASLFTDAYTCTSYPEYEQNKINDLSRMIISCIEAGQTVKYKNYLRRLEMYAFRSVGNSDLYQLTFEYTESYKSFLEGDYTAASKRLEKVMGIFSFLPSSHPWALNLVELKSAISLKSGDIKSYKQSLQSLSDVRRKFYGEKSPVYHKTEMRRALYEINYGKDFTLAENILKNSYTAILQKEIEKESRENIHYLTAYAELFAKTDRYDSARAKAQEATDIAALLYHEHSPEYGLELAELAEFQVLSGAYKEGFENLEKLNGLLDKYKEGDIQLLQKIHMITARLYSLKGEFDRSQSLLNKAYKLTRSGYEKQVLAEAEAYEQLGSLYLLTGNYYKAEKSLLSSLSIREETLEEGTPIIIGNLLELSRLNLLNGNLGPADQYLSRATQLTESVFGTQSILYSECQLVRAEYYMAIGNYKKAEEAALNADAICIRKLGKNSLKRAEVLTRIALIRTKIPSWKATEIDKLYQEASTIIKNALGTENPLYAQLIQKQAALYIASGKTDQAEKLLDVAEKFWSSRLGSENRYSAEIELLKGNIAYNKNNYEKAEKSYSKSRNMYASIFSNNNLEYFNASGKLARVYFMQKSVDKTLGIMEEIIPKYLTYIDNHFPSLSFNDKKEFWDKIKDEFEFYNYVALCISYKENPKLSAHVYDNIISTKALLLSSNLKIRERILSSNDTTLIELYNDWVSQKEYLTNVLSFTRQQLTEQNIDIRGIEMDIDFLEKEMSKRSELFSGEENKKDINWKDIKSRLGEQEYAVEILKLRYFNKTFTDSIIYAALILNSKTEDHPEVIILPDGKVMDKKYLKLYRNSAIFKTKDENSYNVFWKPIKSQIPDGATVYFSSDGVYNQINLEMLVSPEGSYVIDNNQLVLVTNTKDLLNKKYTPVQQKGKGKENRKQQQQEGPYVLCGNPEFYSGEVEVTAQSVQSLPGAEQEVNRINSLLTETGKVAIKLTREMVKEDTIKEIKDPRVFHIATHGYFKEEKGNSEETAANNPLLNSGLVLYAGGDIINHPENNYVNSKDGILTAYEAMNLNFDHTELVVLSACETGLGEVQVGEGVYGLQRSFLIAGADAVIMSLFKVNDEVTNKLMHLFYEKWEKTGDKRKAFIEAKREIKKEYSNPLYWGAFVMIEGKPQVKSNSQP